MTIKQKSFRERENEERKGKKRFIERQVEDTEAQQLINDYLEGKDDEDRPDDRDSPRLLWK